KFVERSVNNLIRRGQAKNRTQREALAAVQYATPSSRDTIWRAPRRASRRRQGADLSRAVRAATWLRGEATPRSFRSGRGRGRVRLLRSPEPIGPAPKRRQPAQVQQTRQNLVPAVGVRWVRPPPYPAAQG